MRIFTTLGVLAVVLLLGGCGPDNHDKIMGDMIKLHDKNSQELIGEINETQLQFLIDELVEEDDSDQDYYINRDQLEQFEKKGGDAALIRMLREALGTRDDMDIAWSKS